MKQTVNRREWMAATAGAVIGATGASAAQAPEPAGSTPQPVDALGAPRRPWKYGLNTSTIRQASLVEKIEAAAAAG